MAILGLSTTIYILGYAFEIGSTRLSHVQTFLKIEYIGITTAPALLLLLVTSFTGHHRFHTTLNYGLLFAIPAIILILAWTNEEHELIWSNMRLERFSNLYIADFEPGLWYWVNVIYYWLMFGSCLFLISRALLRATGLYRRQIAVVLIAILFPVIFNVIYLSRVLSVRIDLIPYAAALTGITLAWGMFNYQFLALIPVAREVVFDSMGDAAIVVDAHQRVVELNPVAQRLLNIDSETNMGKPASEVFAAFPDILRALENEPSINHIEIMIPADGQECFFDVGASLLHSPSGKTEGYLIVLRDITARIQAEQALKGANSRLDILRRVDSELSRKLDVRYTVTLTLDTAMRFSLAGAGLIALAEPDGLRVLYALGRYPVGLENTLMPVDKGIMSRVIQTLQPEMVLDVSQDPDYMAINPDTQAQITVPLVSNEKLIGVISLETSRAERFTPEIFEMVRLIAARAAIAIDNSYMYEERERLVKELDAFAHTVAHDLKNPLTVLKGYSLLLTETYGTVSESIVRQYLATIARTSEKMTSIVNELLLLASVRKMEEVKVGPLDMSSIIADARDRLVTQVSESEAVFTLPDHWPLAIGYRPWVEEVWANYISNAIKYGGTPPQIELGATPLPDGMIRFWVRDNGHGLTPEEQSQLFAEFNRVHQGSVEGHGLGLSIVRRIVEKLGGEVSVESKVGEGSMFSFTLPQADGQGSKTA